MVGDDLRLAVVFRKDLDMPLGKSEVQFGHGVTMLLAEYGAERFGDYLRGPQTKLSLEVDDADALQSLVRRARLRGIPCVEVVDAGRTVFGAPTLTCIALGPMNKTDSNAITRATRMRQ